MRYGAAGHVLLGCLICSCGDQAVQDPDIFCGSSIAGCSDGEGWWEPFDGPELYMLVLDSADTDLCQVCPELDIDCWSAALEANVVGGGCWSDFPAQDMRRSELRVTVPRDEIPRICSEPSSLVQARRRSDTALTFFGVRPLRCPIPEDG